jgi:hypothetical protein
MAALRIPTAPVFRPLLEPARYKGAYGGRRGKRQSRRFSHGRRLCCVYRFQQVFLIEKLIATTRSFEPLHLARHKAAGSGGRS